MLLVHMYLNNYKAYNIVILKYNKKTKLNMKDRNISLSIWLLVFIIYLYQLQF